MVLKSTATSARPETKSLRATIPEGIVEYLSMESGDELEWTMESNDDNERIAVVRKIKENKKKK